MKPKILKIASVSWTCCSGSMSWRVSFSSFEDDTSQDILRKKVSRTCDIEQQHPDGQWLASNITLLAMQLAGLLVVANATIKISQRYYGTVPPSAPPTVLVATGSSFWLPATGLLPAFIQVAPDSLANLGVRWEQQYVHLAQQQQQQ